MKSYLQLVWVDPEVTNQESEEMRSEITKQIVDYMNRLKQKGQLIDANPIDHSGKIVTNKGVLDCPLRMNSLMIGGYFLINADDLESAIKLSKDNPLAEFHTIEVREVMSL